MTAITANASRPIAVAQQDADLLQEVEPQPQISRNDVSTTRHSVFVPWETKFPSEHFLPFNISKCSKIFLDLGANDGWQLEKLFGGLRPRTPLNRIFRKLFSRSVAQRRAEVCAVAFEPDPSHHKRLEHLEAKYQNLGARLRILKSAIWTSEEVLNFSSQFRPEAQNDGSSLETNHSRFIFRNLTMISVHTFDFKKLLQAMPADAFVIAKMDIEGAEHRVIPDIVRTRDIEKINFFAIEFHSWLMLNDQTHMSSPNGLSVELKKQGLKTIVIRLDDER